MKQGIAIITGADGGMGSEITYEVALKGYTIIMICYTTLKGEKIKNEIIKKTGNQNIQVMQADFSSMPSVYHVAERILLMGKRIALLMNNAGTMDTKLNITREGVERTVSVNYLAPYLLTRKLIPLMEKGSRIVNMVSCTYAIGKIEMPHFFVRGRKGNFLRIPIYSNTKLALLLFTLELSDRIKEKGICVNAADPGIVSTPIITMHAWFDPLTDILFRPFIKTPRQGADTAIRLLLNQEYEGKTGTFNANARTKAISDKYSNNSKKLELWEESEKWVRKWL